MSASTSIKLPEFRPIFGNSSILEIVILIEQVGFDIARYHFLHLFLILAFHLLLLTLALLPFITEITENASHSTFLL
jgi:hypothetical protein